MGISDLEYINTGMFTRFMPNTAAGETAWREMAKEEGSAAVLSIHAASVIKQLRKAGYTVTKAKPSPESIDDILAQLNA